MNKYLLIILMLACASCTKEKTYVYEVDPSEVKDPGNNKPDSKTTLEFISIAYYDLFGKNINQSDLTELNILYTAFGDKKTMEDMIIKNFLKKPGVIIPPKIEMRADIPKFLENSYKKFYNRLPNQTENWFLNNLIVSDTSITPELIYYSMLTSNEYKNY